MRRETGAPTAARGVDPGNPDDPTTRSGGTLATFTEEGRRGATGDDLRAMTGGACARTAKYYITTSYGDDKAPTPPGPPPPPPPPGTSAAATDAFNSFDLSLSGYCGLANANHSLHPRERERS